MVMASTAAVDASWLWIGSECGRRSARRRGEVFPSAIQRCQRRFGLWKNHRHAIVSGPPPPSRIPIGGVRFSSTLAGTGSVLGKPPKTEEDTSILSDFLCFLNASWTPFHATMEAKKLLLDAGFLQLNEEDEWSIEPGGRYFFTRNMSTLVAFAIGQKYQTGNGFHVVAAHTDSPCPKLKPVSALSKSGFLNLGVQTYGGGLWHTWFDRDLSVAGRALVKGKDGALDHRLVQVNDPILRIPTLAIHLDKNVNTDGFKPNLETHLAPVLATKIKSELAHSNDGNGAIYSNASVHHPILLQILAKELQCDIEQIADFELNVCDTQPSCIGGAKKEFIFSGRLDNLASSFCALRALRDTCKDKTSLEDESSVRMVALFDNEEVGSDSTQGAGSPIMFEAMKRIATWLSRTSDSEGIVERTIRKSFLVSADMAHALHPNYSEKHEENHQPKLHEGLVIKHNANQRYATNSVTAFLFKEVARLAGIQTQNFIVRNDMGCGSTIGPILASGIGIRTVDCGMPQLSMHSIREMCGTQDIDTAYKHFKAFYRTFTSIDQQVSVDK
ncbi:probable aspartyl aminopeptidase isoform X2 [Selaginella moellendorffii]|uniref:probable aspartyl aminopeptidase isoform X2 n=1 Tax=Selaginella moellendorffii TaxID=88036 RepID=UPI000D1C5EAA|nr:probable aspartyl aminopeptidase isoform X2 [Selaginella moellendorffii]|eukprot:XP_024535841.1 probable aspartyl aminopeptidase isoform X2 [Selaginella moellendorffii]